VSALKATDKEILAALGQVNGQRAAAARMLGMSSRSLMNRLDSMRGRGIAVPPSGYNPATAAHRAAGAEVRPAKLETVEIPRLPDGSIDIGDLIERRKSAFNRRDEAARARKIIPVKVRSRAPIGIVLLGDPHVDDDGTDLGRLELDIAAIRRTDGMFAACVGDLQNNWVGRLARLYGSQETTAEQAWQLVEWFVRELRHDWLFMVQGNHDHWSGAGDPLRWIQRQASVSLTGDHTVRIALSFPNGVEIRLAARHDWPGNSMWNPSHGQLRAARLTHHDDIIVSGHKHTGGYQLIRNIATGRLAHLLQLGSYKTHDSYADTLGLPMQMISPSAAVIIDPMGGDGGTVRVEHDIDAAADLLTWMRERHRQRFGEEAA
jgi:hypothetical protein